MSKLGKIGASLALQVKPTALPRSDWPGLLAGCTGSVSRLDEQVISPASFIADLASQHRDRILQIDAERGLQFISSTTGLAPQVHITDANLGKSLVFEPHTIILAAGQGNADLRSRLRLSAAAMQRRPLHVTMVRGSLPHFNGHCIAGSRTCVTITSDTDSQGRTVWQIGGQVSEDGVVMNRFELIAHVQRELLAAVPALCEMDFKELAWSTYRINRAEGATPIGQRPADAVVLHEGPIITCWPTKLVLVPQAVMRIRQLLKAPSKMKNAPFSDCFSDWPGPAVALPPWEMEREWL